MMPRLTATLFVIAALGGPAPAAAPHKATPPKTLGACAFTTISEVGERFEDQTHKPVPNSGSMIRLANGVYGVSYDEVPAVNASRVGDRVMTCLAKVPHHCPPGDQRGKWYTTTNLRTDEAWTLPDAEHECGGA
jgi:hypothetical protein